MKKYGFNTFWSEEDEGFIATCPDFPGLSAFGETAAEAIQEAMVALEGFIEIISETGKSLPEPTVQPEYSGQLRLRLPRDLHAKLACAAKVNGVSFNTYVISKLSESEGSETLARAIMREMRTEIKRAALPAQNNDNSSYYQIEVPGSVGPLTLPLPTVPQTIRRQIEC